MTNLSKKKLIIASIALVVLYVWILGVIGMYGAFITPYIRFISIIVLKYGGALAGLLICAMLPFKIQAANLRNAQKLEEYKAKLALEAKIAKEKQQAAIIKKLEETQYYE